MCGLAAVGALVGHQTRQHNDIDIYIQKKDEIVFVELLISSGYRETKMEYTTDDHTVWQDSDNRTIDLHLFEFAEMGTLRFENQIYPSSIFNGKGKIGGISVHCLTVEAQLQYHQGYEHGENDVLLLCKTFGLPVPEKFMG